MIDKDILDEKLLRKIDNQLNTLKQLVASHA